MIERMARALWDDREAHQHPRCRQTWEQGSETARRFAMDHCRAILTAMREPTEAMVRAWVRNSPGGSNAQRDWNTMIDAALAPPINDAAMTTENQA